MHCSVQSNRAFRHFMLLRSLLIVVAFVNGARMVHIIYTTVTYVLMITATNSLLL
jgi:diacylglycerol kinase